MFLQFANYHCSKEIWFHTLPNTTPSHFLILFEREQCLVHFESWFLLVKSETNLQKPSSSIILKNVSSQRFSLLSIRKLRSRSHRIGRRNKRLANQIWRSQNRNSRLMTINRPRSSHYSPRIGCPISFACCRTSQSRSSLQYIFVYFCRNGLFPLCSLAPHSIQKSLYACLSRSRVVFTNCLP